MEHPYFVIPAKAGTQARRALRLPLWVPAFAGMTSVFDGMN
jgi:hypothetical protein